MKQDVTFSKLKLTNNKQSEQNHVILNSMHRYQPRVIITEDLGAGREGDVIVSQAWQETQFMAVTAYQNTDVSTELCSAGMVGLAPKWVRLAPNGTNPGFFQIRFHLKKPQICPILGPI